jgi:hypothetical protein
MKRALLGLTPLTLVVASLTFGCGGDDAPSTTDDTTGDGDGDTAGDGDGDAGDGDGAPGDGDGDAGDGDGDPGPDTDMDGTPDSSDNCPDIANPNQLDYDDNGLGNVCDTQVFTTVTGTLNTSANANAGIGGACSIPLMIQVTSGEIRVQLDDDAAMAGFEIVNLQIADVLDQVCELAVTAEVSMTGFQITNSGGDFPVNMPHTLAMHNGGQVAGTSNGPHPVLSTASLVAAVDGMAQPPSDLMLDGELPVFTANITMMGATGTMSFMDPNFVLAMDQFMVEVGIPITIDFDLTGLVGTLSLAP